MKGDLCGEALDLAAVAVKLNRDRLRGDQPTNPTGNTVPATRCRDIRFAEPGAEEGPGAGNELADGQMPEIQGVTTS